MPPKKEDDRFGFFKFQFVVKQPLYPEKGTNSRESAKLTEPCARHGDIVEKRCIFKIKKCGSHSQVQYVYVIQGDPKFRPPLPSEDRKFL